MAAADHIDPAHFPSYRHYLFVYGTMLAGHRNHARLAALGADFLFEATTKDAAFAMSSRISSGGYRAPVAWYGGDARIAGEVYEIGGRGFRELDIAEGHPKVYRRILTPVTGKGRLFAAWAYLFPRSPLDGDQTDIVRDGDLVRFQP